MIQLQGLQKDYEGSLILKDITATINDRDVIAIIGPSGSGKSTLLHCINLLDPPSGGQILLDGVDVTASGQDVSQVRQRIGMVFQKYYLFQHLTVVENVMAPLLDLKDASRKEAYEKAMELLRIMSMADKALHYPDELSGGQQQRVAIARALATDPDIILFDEPTSALDPIMSREVQGAISQLASMGRTMMIVSHEMQFVQSVSNRVFFLDEGVIYEEGSPEDIFKNPQKEKTRRFVKELNVLRLGIESRDFDFHGNVSRVEDYCYRNHIEHKRVNKLQRAVEELISQILLPQFPQRFKLEARMEYEAESDTISVEVVYDGPVFSPEDSDNDLALLMLNGVTENLRHEAISDGPFTNKVAFLMK